VTVWLNPHAPARPLPRWGFAAAALGVMAFIAYGSYVPFDWRQRPWDEVRDAFVWTVQTRAVPDSRSDWAANVALGVPLGFCLLGFLRANKPGKAGAFLAGVPVVAFSTLYAASIEFGQLYTRDRTCSGSDIWAQGFGAMVGVAAWALAGPWAAGKAWAALRPDGVKTTTAPLLVGYAAVLLLIQTLPLDLTASPYGIAKRLRDPASVTLIPLTDPLVGEWKKTADWCELFALFVPAGALAAGLPGKWRSANGLFHAAGCGFAFALTTELAQVLVQSRHAGTTDAIVGGVGFLAGWVAARILSDRGVKKYRPEVAAGAVQAWFAVLAVIAWQPFDFHPQLLESRLHQIDWWPLGPQVAKNYLWALNEILSKFVVYAPLGAVLVWASARHHERSRPVLAAVACGLLTAVLELGQAMTPGRHVSPTDVLFGLVGGYLGGECVRRAMGVRVRVVTARPDGPPPAGVSAPLPPPLVLPEPAAGEAWWAAAERAFPARPTSDEADVRGRADG
jgi:VanZ family protein